MTQEVLNGVAAIIIYYLICATTALVIRCLIKIPDEIFRKTLHCILLFSLIPWVLCFNTWWISALCALAFAALVYPALCLAEKIKNYSKIVTERKGGELKRSLLIVFSMFAAIISICWGWLGDKMLVFASVYAWGFGDAAAALVGKRFGRHALEGQHIQGRKSKEGTFAMFIVSFISVITIMIIRGGLSWYAYIIIAAAAAVVSAVVELYSMDGMDTITCPLAAMAVIIPLTYLFGGIII